MATGYTYPIESGQDTSLRGFAMRLEGISGEWQRREASAYKYVWLMEATERLQTVANWSDDEADAAAELVYENALVAFRDYRVRSFAEQERYGTLLAQVTAWEVPEILAALRYQMIEMLTKEIEKAARFDYPAPVRQSGQEYRLCMMEHAGQQISRHAQDWREEQKRVTQRNEYMAALFAALERVDK